MFAKCVTKSKEIPIGSKEYEFPLAVGLVYRPIHISLGQRVKFGLEFGIEFVDVPNINVIGEAASARRGGVCTGLLPDSESGGFALYVRVVVNAKRYVETQDLREELERAFEVVDNHEWRDLNEIGRNAPPVPWLIQDLPRVQPHNENQVLPLPCPMSSDQPDVAIWIDVILLGLPGDEHSIRLRDGNCGRFTIQALGRHKELRFSFRLPVKTSRPKIPRVRSVLPS